MLYKIPPLALAVITFANPSIKSQGPIGGATPEPLESFWTYPSYSYSHGQFKKVICLSFDGMYQSDLVKYIELFPNSTWASVMTKTSAVFNIASAAEPFESFLVTVVIMPEASPRLSGVNWDDTGPRMCIQLHSTAKDPLEPKQIGLSHLTKIPPPSLVAMHPTSPQPQ